MSTSSLPQATTDIRFEFLNWLTDPMPRDQTQSRRLHEPEHGVMTAIDPAYKNTPVDHPNLRLPYPGADDDDRGG